MQQILLNFLFLLNIAIHKFQFFVFMGIAKLHAKMTCIHANIRRKKIDVNFVLMRNFVQKN